MKIERVFSKDGVHPFDEVTWVTRQASIKDASGATIFEKSIEAPESWSDMACTVVASKYLAKDETSVKAMLTRVCKSIMDAGQKSGYFHDYKASDAFYSELLWLCLNQYGSFNSPVWFNVGLSENPQVSACFIQSVEDNMDSIMDLAKNEATLFKHGSGTGTDLSTLRSSKERLSSGGKPSGPLSFMRVYDQIAAVVKSGGKTRRAAKMQSLRVDHPDIMEFITCKQHEDEKARALVAAGYGPEAYDTVAYQNANLSVRVTDEFMDAVIRDDMWHTMEVTTTSCHTFTKARDVFRAMAAAAHACGDPGIQYHDTINRWHTCSETGPINASNPCSEYMFLDDSACNLASLNLMKFRREDGTFDIDRFRAAVRIFIIAQDILVDLGSYPTPSIETNSWRFRPLGLGFANLGALVMSCGFPYDSDDARSLAGSIAALMTGQAYLTSAEIAKELGSFPGYDVNREAMGKVLEGHAGVVYKHVYPIAGFLYFDANAVWTEVLKAPQFRNAQVTCVAPTGTIGFMMDCDTTGIEPVLALETTKHLAGGGELKLTPKCVGDAWAAEAAGAPSTVLDCALPDAKRGGRCIPYMAHLKMMAAVQPFISGAISKTINMPSDATVEDVEAVFMEGWKMGLKSVTVYRDGSKQFQPVSTGPRPVEEGATATYATDKPSATPARRRLSETRDSVTHKFSVAKHEGYITVGLYEDGTPGELFITMTKAGSTLGGLMDCFATSVSLNLQYGVPLESLVKKFQHVRFEPAGMTGSKDIPFAKSLVDYVFTWLGRRFLPGTPAEVAEVKSAAPVTTLVSPDAPPCDVCGSITVRNGTCFKCGNCGNSLGCS